MFMNQNDIEWAAKKTHRCPNVQKGIKLLLDLCHATNRQSDGWAHTYNTVGKSCEKLIALLRTAGNLNYGTDGTITEAELKAAIVPIRRMVTHQSKKQKQYGNTFEFDVDASLNPPKVAQWQGGL